MDLKNGQASFPNLINNLVKREKQITYLLYDFTFE